MPRGGKRQGSPGQAYSNRTDLMQDYSGAASDVTPRAAAAPTGMPQTPALTPDQTPFPRDPSARPYESIGTAANTPPNAMAPGQGINPGLEALRAVYQATGNLRILDMIEWHERFS